MFEYGGVAAQNEEDKFKVKTMNTDKNGDIVEVEAYILGLGVKEIREESFDPKLVIYVAGDFLGDEIKKSQFIHDWAWLRVSIGLYEIASKRDV